MPSTKSKFSLPQSFVEFHLELEHQRDRVASGDTGSVQDAAPGGGVAGAESGAGSAPSNGPGDVLQALFERQAKAAATAGKGVELHEAQYAMAVQADEVFTKLSWPGKDAWIEKPLEQKLYRSNCGGQRIYEKIDQLLKQPPGDDAEMGKVYLLLLSLGFRGRYQGNEETTHIEAFRRDLYSWTYGRDADESPASERLFAAAYEHTVDNGSSTLLRGSRGWVLALVAALLLLFGASQWIWNAGTSGVEEILERIGQAG